MTAPISLDIRRRFSVLVGRGMSARQAARQLMISPASGTRLGKRIREGQGIEFSTVGNRLGTGRLDRYKAFFEEVLCQDPDMTLRELQSALLDAHKQSASISGLHYALRRMGFTFKKRRWSLPSGISPE